MSALGGDAAPTASFAEDGTVSGNAGCNTYNGPWTQSDDRTDISVGPLATTRMACADQDANDQETSLLQALEASVSADVTTHAATFYNDDGWRTVTLTRGRRRPASNPDPDTRRRSRSEQRHELADGFDRRLGGRLGGEPTGGIGVARVGDHLVHRAGDVGR